MAMIKKLTRVGNSTAVILDKAVLSLVELEADSDIRITVEGDAICIRRHPAASDARVQASAAKVFRTRRRLMQQLAK
jgi:antitoxin component of MazEF toxin-antitoxin module